MVKSFILQNLHLIDGHAHLESLQDTDSAVIRARTAGVRSIIAVGMDLASNLHTLELARKFPETVYPAVGYHPWSILPEKIEENIDFIEKQLPRCIALGEVGLDYKVKIKKPIQWQVFERVLGLANQHAKPVIVHSRFSHQRCHRMVAAAGVSRAVFHWYSGPLDLLEQILADGFHVSATPALAYSQYHRAAIQAAPLNRILVETDCPVAYQGRTSEPANLIDTLEALSELKGLDLDEVASVTADNTRRFFDL